MKKSDIAAKKEEKLIKDLFSLSMKEKKTKKITPNVLNSAIIAICEESKLSCSQVENVLFSVVRKKMKIEASRLRKKAEINRKKEVISRATPNIGKLRKHIGEKIRVIRIENNMTQEDLALHVGLSQGYINQLENGKKRASLEALSKIAEAFGMKIKGFMPE